MVSSAYTRFRSSIHQFSWILYFQIESFSLYPEFLSRIFDWPRILRGRWPVNLAKHQSNNLSVNVKCIAESRPSPMQEAILFPIHSWEYYVRQIE